MELHELTSVSTQELISVLEDLRGDNGGSLTDWSAQGLHLPPSKQISAWSNERHIQEIVNNHLHHELDQVDIKLIQIQTRQLISSVFEDMINKIPQQACTALESFSQTNERTIYAIIRDEINQWMNRLSSTTTRTEFQSDDNDDVSNKENTIPTTKKFPTTPRFPRVRCRLFQSDVILL